MCFVILGLLATLFKDENSKQFENQKWFDFWDLFDF
jgi:hypothetical protein